MQLQEIELQNLKTTTLNVRKKDKTKINDLVPSIRSIGLIQPLLVRPNCEGYEVVAGQRRFFALQQIAQETENNTTAVPCLVMDEGDDAKALEASLAENVARLPMDDIDQYKAFAKLVKAGNTVSDIANQFGITERLIKQRLAIANLIQPLLTAYQKNKIDAETIRLLTMASKSQQKNWLALFSSEEEYAPEGYVLKRWLFGGAEIATTNALFEVENYSGSIITDLFGEEKYFDDAEKFWLHQNTAIAELKEQYLANGWADVTVLDIGAYFPVYDYIDTSKKNGGKVYIAISHIGEVTCYEGQLSRLEGRRLTAKADNSDSATQEKATKPELTQAMQNYLDLHRHSAVRTTLLGKTGLAVRLAVAQMIAGSALWSITADPQRAQNESIQDSLATNKAQVVFDKEREHVRELLGITSEVEKGANNTLLRGRQDVFAGHDIHEVFTTLLSLDDAEVSRILTFVVAESLTCGASTVDALGQILEVDMASHWQADECFFTLLRDKQTINAVLKEVAGKKTADANITSTAKLQKILIVDRLITTDKKAKSQDKKNWLPRYFQFPMKAYTKQGGIRAIESWKAVKKHYD